MEVVEYDPKVLQEFAEKLYSRARGLALSYAFRWFVLGAIVGALAMYFVARGMNPGVGALAVGIVAGIMGYSAGWAKAFELRLEAQRALCALQTEINTRACSATITSPRQRQLELPTHCDGVA